MIYVAQKLSESSSLHPCNYLYDYLHLPVNSSTPNKSRKWRMKIPEHSYLLISIMGYQISIQPKIHCMNEIWDVLRLFQTIYHGIAAGNKTLQRVDFDYMTVI